MRWTARLSHHMETSACAIREHNTEFKQDEVEYCRTEQQLADPAYRHEVISFSFHPLEHSSLAILSPAADKRCSPQFRSDCGQSQKLHRISHQPIFGSDRLAGGPEQPGPEQPQAREC